MTQAPPRGDIARVYVCYSREDQDFVMSLEDALEKLDADLSQRRIELWVDFGLESGKEWESSVTSAIENADVFLFVVSQHSLNSDRCISELDFAASLDKPVIDVFYQEVPSIKRLPLALHDRPYIEFLDVELLRESEFERTVQHLAEVIINAVDREFEVQRDREPELAAPDLVPTHPDRPAVVDELGRQAFAQALAVRLRRMRLEDDQASFMLHIYGPWGSGKSFILHFMSQELRTKGPRPWVVVEFNAWQHQRTGPPWWWLINSVFQQGVQQLRTIQRRRSADSPVRDRLGTLTLILRDWARYLQLVVQEHAWRFLKTGRTLYLLALALIFGSIWLVASLGLFNLDPAQTDQATRIGTVTRALYANIEGISGIFTVITAGWAIVTGISRSLLPASTQAAEDFMRSTRDPMQVLTQHFNYLVDKLRYPVAVFIDDLDRCQGSYVVDLLEGIQTLFREAPVAYVVAADRRWVCTSYEKGYEDFADVVKEPGRTIGYLFLEKTFQLSTPVPVLSPTVKAEFWQRLLQVTQHEDGDDSARRLEAARRSVREALRSARTEEDIRRIALQPSESDPIVRQAYREEAVIRLGTAEVEAHTEHALKDFADLLEPNPRAMKRLVNAYGVRRSVDWLAGGNTNSEQLALYTILELRWPLLAEYLAEHPSMVEHIGSDRSLENIPETKKVPENVRTLFTDQDVLDVILGRTVAAFLDEAAIRACAGLVAAVSSTQHSAQ